MEYGAELLPELVLVFLLNLIAHLDPALNTSLLRIARQRDAADVFFGCHQEVLSRVLPQSSVGSRRVTRSRARV